MKLSTTFSRLMIFLRLQLDLVVSQLLAAGRPLCSRSRSDQHALDRFGADAGGEGVFAILVLRFEELVLGQQLELLQRRQARLGDDVALEIEHALELLELHVEQQADAARQRLQEPDMRNRRGQFDVAHALAANLGHGHFDAALLADDALVLHALVLAAQALVVLDRTEDARAEQTVTLGLERPVVDRLGLLDLAEGPRADRLGRGDADLDLVEGFRLCELVREFGQFVHDFPGGRFAPTAGARSIRAGVLIRRVSGRRRPRPRREDSRR